jgi:minor extracellular serine protease Vpr
MLGSLRAADPPNFSGRYALILTDPSAAEFSRAHGDAPLAVENHRQKIRAAQDGLRSELTRRNYAITGSVQTVLNAVFVAATPAQLAELRSLPGVLAVRPLRRFHRKLDQAVKLINANPAGWNLVGGKGNAGLGLKIAIIDTGIDQTHPAFQDNSLTIPSGFPKCNAQSDCDNFTNHKVIVARSYVKQLATGTGANPAATSLPDDYSARDRIGHGTAVAMCAAGETNTGPADTITGVAPKAYLGNYKIFGSAEINGGASTDVIISALEDALNDGMDVASLSLGGPAFSGPLDTGAACGAPVNTPCDPEATALDNAVKSGMMVVAAAGNEAQDGVVSAPTFNTIDSPGDAPSAIAVAGSTNAHTWGSGVRVSGNGVPSTIQLIQGQFSADGPQPSGPLSAPLVDVTKVSSDPLGCTSFSGSLTNDFVLIERGTCNFSVKVLNAQTAGAIGVIVYDPSSDSLISPSGLANTSIPLVLIGETGGLALKAFIDAHAGYSVTMDPSLIPLPATPNIMTVFSSRGPSIDGQLKPDVTAVGQDLYMAAESYDPTGEVYSPNRYTVAAGTSFSTPQVSGAVALVKQAHPNFTPAQLKSAVVNTGASGLTEDGSKPTSVLSAGAGLLNVGAAIGTTVTVAPASISFGYLDVTAFPPASQTLTVTNTASSTVNLALSIVPSVQDTKAHLTLSKTALQLGAGQSTTVTVTLGGTMPVSGEYEGVITISGGAKTLQVPYLYILGDGVPFNITPIISLSTFDCTVGQALPQGGIAFQVIDQFGEPVTGVPIRWTVTQGGGSISSDPNLTDSATEQPSGIGFATATCGSTPGNQEFVATAGGLQAVFDGVARVNPTISTHGAVSAADFQATPGAVPGSYIALFGTGLSDPGFTDVANFAAAPYLPLAIDFVSVSFDVPSAGLSLPGQLYYVSPGQINVQVPWELQGQSSAFIKVTIEDSQGSLYTLPLAPYAPAFFDYVESSTKNTLVMALDASGKVIGSTNAATRGQVVHLYANGLGPVNNQPPDGQPTPASPQSATTSAATVTIGGQPATVQFSGLAPGAVGLYELIVGVPSGISTGLQPAVVSINGQASPAVSLPIQ